MNRLLVSLLALTVLVSTLVPATPARAAGNATATADLLERIDQYITDAVKSTEISGFSVAVVQNGQLAMVKGYGLTAGNGGRPVTPETVFPLASTTKPITVTAILQLRDQGRLDLDDPVQKHLPWFRVADAEASRQITIRHLITHTSGIPEVGGTLLLQNPSVAGSAEEGVRALANIKLFAPPGQTYRYSNLGYSTLGLIVEQVSGKPFDVYLQEQILGPLGMAKTATLLNKLPQADAAVLHVRHFLGQDEVDPLATPWLVPAGAGPVSTPSDMAKFLVAHMEAGPVQLLGPATLAEAHTGSAPKGNGELYGLGWMVKGLNGTRLVYHSGGTYGAMSWVGMLPDQKAGVVVMGNLTSAYTWGIGQNVARILAGQEPQPISDPLLLIKRIVLGLGAFALLLLAGLILAVRRDRSGALTGRPWRIARAVLMSLTAVGAVAVTFVLHPAATGAPLPFGFRGYMPDEYLMLRLFVLVAVLWAGYALFRCFVPGQGAVSGQQRKVS